MSSGKLAPSVTLDRYEAHLVIERLRTYEGSLLKGLHDKVFTSWRLRGANQTITVPLTQRELEVMRRLGASSSPKVVRYKWFAIYRQQSGEVYTRTTFRPPKRKTLRVAGSGRKKYTLYKLYRLPLNTKESEELMARAKAAKKKPADEEIDELEGLEELEDDDEVEEPEVEEDEDEEEEKPKKRSRSRKKAAEKPAKKRTRKKAEVEEEDEEDEEDEDEDEEEEAPKKRTRAKKSTAKPSKSEKSSKKKGKGGPAAGRTTKEMTGGVGTAELAEAASEIADLDITGRDVRVWLRKNEVEKDEEHGRYVWKSATNKTFVKLARQIAKAYEED